MYIEIMLDSLVDDSTSEWCGSAHMSPDSMLRSMCGFDLVHLCRHIRAFTKEH